MNSTYGTQIPSDPAGLPEASSIHNSFTKRDVSPQSNYLFLFITQVGK